MGSTLSNLVYHVVFSTKNREPLLIPAVRDDLYRYIAGIIKKEKGVLIQIGGMPDHLHLVVKLNPAHSLSDIMKNIKAGSSKWINEQKMLMGRFGWQEGYGAFTISESQLPGVIRYVNEQENHHRTLSFKDEFVLFLKRHRIEYDDRYIWS